VFHTSNAHVFHVSQKYYIAFVYLAEISVTEESPSVWLASRLLVLRPNKTNLLISNELTKIEQPPRKI